jgi:UDP-2-acetamido-3-amino-2,3-dideoxy-glucuronate N-acetyltransferase
VSIKNIINNISIGKNVKIGRGTKIWKDVQIENNVKIGKCCVIGSKVYIGPGVEIGSNVKIQNNSLIYEGSRIGDGVFIGPNVILTNDNKPRAINLSGRLKDKNEWNLQNVVICEGASIGAGSVLVAPIKIGVWAMVGAGSVVTNDVKNYSLVVGVPAKHFYWISPEGDELKQLNEVELINESSGKKYRVTSSGALPL